MGEALEAEFPDQKFAAGEDNKVTKSFDVSKANCLSTTAIYLVHQASHKLNGH